MTTTASRHVERLFDNYSTDFLDEDFLLQNELADCYLSEEALEEFLAPPQDNWRDFMPTENPAIITLDSSKQIQWDLAKAEIMHLRMRMAQLLGESEEDVVLPHIVEFFIGADSKIGKFLQDELELDKQKYLAFISTICGQSAYRMSSTQLFHRVLLLRDKMKITGLEYNRIWKDISIKKKIPRSQIATNRRASPLWESMEIIVNELLCSICVTQRTGRISISLDDDKIWMNLSKAGRDDLFNIKYTTHVKPNRKGIIAHTAVSTGTLFPLGICFERTRDSTLNCFRRLLDGLFGSNGETNLRFVSVHSDRGYMIPNLVFEYLISAGAEVVGTVKRMAQCWPFTYDQKLAGKHDKRTLIESKGAATLFLKWCKTGAKYVFASAFRNGSGSVATAISTLHTQHQWEGIALDKNELAAYLKDRKCLKGKFFERVSELDGVGSDESVEEREKLDDLLENKIVPYTLRQGKVFF